MVGVDVVGVPEGEMVGVGVNSVPPIEKVAVFPLSIQSEHCRSFE